MVYITRYFLKMKHVIIFLLFLTSFSKSSWAQTESYNCFILDSIISAIQIKEAQNNFLFPLFKSGEIKTDGESIQIKTKNTVKIKKIDSVLNGINIKERNYFLDDVLFSLDTLNIIVDTFKYFDNSCNLFKNKGNRYVVVNDYGIISQSKKPSNIIVVDMIGYNSKGAMSIVLRNTKSKCSIIFGVRHGAVLHPSISIIGKCQYDPVEGLSLE